MPSVHSPAISAPSPLGLGGSNKERKRSCSIVVLVRAIEAMARRATVMVLAVLLLAASSSTAPVASAARDDPAAAAVSSFHDQGSAAEGKVCEGANDEDECMMRRTLAAHTDYIYTQQHHN